MARAEPLLWWSRRELEQLSGLLTPAWTDWLRGWHGAATGISVRCVPAHEAPHLRSWGALAASGEALAWWDRADSEEVVATSLFGAQRQVAAASLAGGLEQRARRALGDSLGGALGLLPSTTHETPRAAQFEPWSGSVIVQFAAPARMARIILNGACVSTLLGPPDMPAARQDPVEEGVPALSVRARVELTGCDITLGSLQSIRCGDILRLPHSLDDPLDVTVQSARLCTAFLGARDGQRAVELAPA